MINNTSTGIRHCFLSCVWNCLTQKCLRTKKLLGLCWFYMGIAQIALDLPPFSQTGKCGKKVPQTILASLYTPLPPYGQCPYGYNTFQEGAFLTPFWISMDLNICYLVGVVENRVSYPTHFFRIRKRREKQIQLAGLFSCRPWKRLCV